MTSMTTISPSEEEAMAREGFVVYHELLDWLEPYGDAERGRLLTAMLRYSITGEAPGLSGNERFLWPAIKAKIDRDRGAYEETCRKNKKNVEKRYDKVRENTTVYDRIPDVPTETETETGTETETKTESPSEKERAHKHGEYGWVRLTETQYRRLLQDLGPAELDRCIQYIDESAQRTGNKNKWKDWNLTIRKCAREGWGKDQSSSRNVVHKENRNAPIDTAKLEMLSNMFQ